jgi:hypothetical protein
MTPPDEQVRGYHRQQVGDGRGRGGAFVGDEPVVQDIGRAGSQHAKDADGSEDGGDELDRLQASERRDEHKQSGWA